MTTATLQSQRQGPRPVGAEGYVTFLIADETYAIPALSVREVIRWIPATRVPNAAAAVKGVINLRGEIVTVLDLRVRLSLPPAEPTDRTCIVVVTMQRGERRLQAGLIVDTALDVTRILADDIEPRDTGTLTNDCVTGVARTKTGLTILLDVEPMVIDGLSSTAAA